MIDALNGSFDEGQLLAPLVERIELLLAEETTRDDVPALEEPVRPSKVSLAAGRIGTERPVSCRVAQLHDRRKLGPPEAMQGAHCWRTSSSISAGPTVKGIVGIGLAGGRDAAGAGGGGVGPQVGHS